MKTGNEIGPSGRLMKLMTKALKKQFEKVPIHSTDGEDTKNVIAKYFTPDAGWTWYAVESDGDDLFYGYVESGIGSDCNEWGYFRLSELKTIRGSFGLPVERDRFFEGREIGIDGDIKPRAEA
tara:strand:+ start:1604 stop:1972 length:369 start_codon:yes stop_codon:yes gene_type:complete